MSSLRPTPVSIMTSSVSVMRPPKPPCWRDFVYPAPRSSQSEGFDLPDSAVRAIGAKSPTAELVESGRGSASVAGVTGASGVRNSRPRRPRARIHRTRSEHIIDDHELPESAFTATLADAEPKGVRSRRPIEVDGRLYVEENNRRCQTWLATLHASAPLDEVDYASEDPCSGNTCSGNTCSDNTSEPSAVNLTSEEPDASKSQVSPVVTTASELPVNSPGSTAVSSVPGVFAVTNDSETPALTRSPDVVARLKDDNENISRRSDSNINPNSIPIHDLGSSIDVEIPEETFIWSVPHEVRLSPRPQSVPLSVSSGEDVCCSCTKSTASKGDKKLTAAATLATTITSGINLVLNNVGDFRKSFDGLSKPHRQSSSQTDTDFTHKHSAPRKQQSQSTVKCHTEGPKQICDLKTTEATDQDHSREIDVSRGAEVDRASRVVETGVDRECRVGETGVATASRGGETGSQNVFENSCVVNSRAGKADQDCDRPVEQICNLNHLEELGHLGGSARRTSSQSVLCDTDLWPLDQSD